MNRSLEERTMNLIQKVPIAVRVLGFITQTIIIIIIVIAKRFLKTIRKNFHANYHIFSWLRRFIFLTILRFESVVFTGANALLWESLCPFPIGWILGIFVTFIIEKSPMFFIRRSRRLRYYEDDVFECMKFFIGLAAIAVHAALLIITIVVGGLMIFVILVALKNKT